MPNIVEVAEELIWRLSSVLFPLEALWNSIYLLMDILFFGVSVLRRRWQITALLLTHDQAEAFALQVYAE